MYVALSQVAFLGGLYSIGTYDRAAIRVDTKPTAECSYMKRHCQFQTVEYIGHVSSNSLIVTLFIHCLVNIRSLQKHVTDIR